MQTRGFSHALVLGTDVQEWYKSRNNTITITQHDYLDNIAWLYSKLIEYRFDADSSVMPYLQNEFQKYFQIIYRDNIRWENDNGCNCTGEDTREQINTEFNINTYYNAWMLRGDDPEEYKTGRYRATGFTEAWEWNSPNRMFPQDKSIRNNAAVSFLYYTYHYNGNVKKTGQQSIEVTIPRNVIRAIEMVQDRLQRIVAYKGICIETNPSSNCLIGTFGKYSYEKHPILKFYNVGLETTDEDIKRRCNNISVCINTDDQSVFKTSLENEYAFLVRALECAKNDDGSDKYGRSSIYSWIDSVRQTGLDFSFDS